MFDKKTFSEILTRIYKTYPNQRAFADATGVNRAYLSQYINMKLDSPPSPKILKGISNAAKGVTTYDELMKVCGHLSGAVTNSLMNSQYFAQIPLFFNLQEFLVYNIDRNIEYAPHNYYTSIYTKDNPEDFFAFKAFDDSMIPLLDVGDIAIIHRQNTFEDKQTHLILLDDDTLLIRKIIVLEDGLELHSANPSPKHDMIKLTNEEMKKRKFTILGKVIKAENKSAFK